VSFRSWHFFLMSRDSYQLGWWRHQPPPSQCHRL